MGRFLSRDTWQINTQYPMELNRYVYAAANPVRWGDPSGYALAEQINLRRIGTASAPVLLNVGRQVGVQFARTTVALLRNLAAQALVEWLRDQLDILDAEDLLPRVLEYVDIKSRVEERVTDEVLEEVEEEDCEPWTDWTPPYEITGDPVGAIHHIATNKHTSYWTPIFTGMFAQGGMTLQDHWNLIRLSGHSGRHRAVYHQHIFDRLELATQGKICNPYRHALQQELWTIKVELMTPGSYVRGLLRLR